jgi:hypothetical protein
MEMKNNMNRMIKTKWQRIWIIMSLLFTSAILTSMMVFIDSFNGLYLQKSTSILGNTDIMITRGSSNEIFNMHFSENIEKELEKEFSNIQFFPRLYSIIKSDIYNPAYLSSSQNLVICGINSTQEQKAQQKYIEERKKQQFLYYILSGNNQTILDNKMGYLWLCDENLERTGDYLEEEIPFGQCVITRSMALGLNASVGQKYEFRTISGIKYLTIMAIVENDGRFPNTATGLVITDLKWLQYMLNMPNQINSLIGIFNNPEKIYDISNLESTLDNVNKISIKITSIIGEDFTILFPRLQTLQLSTTEIIGLFVGLDILQILIIIATLFIWLFIAHNDPDYQQTINKKNDEKQKSKNDLLKSSLRYCGKYFGFPTILGLLSGILFSFLLLFNTFTINSIIKSAVIIFGLQGISYIMILAKIQRNYPCILNQPKKIENQNPYSRIATTNKNFISLGTGLVLSFTSIGILISLPSILLAPNQSTLRLFLGMIAFSLFIGLLMIVYAIIPVCEKWFEKILIPVMKKRKNERISTDSTNQISHNQYNAIILILFSLCFSLIGFQQLKHQNLENEIMFKQGADMIISNSGNIENNNYVNLALLNKLRNNSEIQIATPIYYSFSNFERSQENIQSFNLDLDVSSQTQIVKNYTTVEDLGNWEKISMGLIGIAPEIAKVMDLNLTKWDSKSGSNVDAFNRLFLHNEILNENTEIMNCIISKMIADQLHISLLDTLLVLNVHSGTTNNQTNQVLLKIVGISTGIPGFNNFYTQNPFSNPKPAIIINQENYYKVMGYSAEIIDQIPIDEIFIAFNQTSNMNVIQFIENFNLDFQKDYKYQIIEPIAKLEYLLQGYERLDQMIQFFQWIGICYSLIITLLLSQSVKENPKNKEFINCSDCRDQIGNQFPKLAIIQTLLLIFCSMVTGILFIVSIFYMIAHVMQIPQKLFLDFKELSYYFIVLFILSGFLGSKKR